MKSKIFLVVIALLMAVPAFAGRYVLKYEEKGQVSVEIFTDKFGREKIFFRALPLTGDRTPGPAVLRLDGVYVAQWRNPAYEFEFELDAAAIPSLEGDSKKDGELFIPWLKGDRSQEVDLRRLTVGIHTVEVYFASKDGNGRLDRNRTAAPATQFRVEKVDPPKAAETISGSPLTASQLEAAIKQGYEKGVSESRSAAAQEREQLMAQLKKATDELNELRRQSTLKTQPKAMPYGKRYLPIRWQERDWPTYGDEMDLIDATGRLVSRAKVVEVVRDLGRFWVSTTVPIDFDPAGCTIKRSTGRKEDKR